MAHLLHIGLYTELEDNFNTASELAGPFPGLHIANFLEQSHENS